jgi:glycosyltransferase involved in cell wall biosynthesis
MTSTLAPDRTPSQGRTGNLLCVSNFQSNVGFAWDFIEGLYAAMADRLAPAGVRTYVAYPELRSSPRPLAGTTAIPIELAVNVRDRHMRRALLRFVRENDVRVVYLTDRPACSPLHTLLKRAGVRHIVVHDHSSGALPRPKGIKRLAKWMYARIPTLCADVVVTVSDFVRERDIAASMLPSRRVLTVWNGIPLPAAAAPRSHRLRDLAGVSEDDTVLACCCRASPVKGVHHLLHAFTRAFARLESAGVRPILVYIGDGPQLAELETIRDSSPVSGSIRFLGYQPAASALLADADACVVPSVWEDALPLGVMEPMAHGKPVIASAVGGIPEMIEHRVTGLLVAPSDEDALASAIVELLTDPGLGKRLGTAARRRVAERFRPEDQVARLTSIIGRGFETRHA